MLGGQPHFREGRPMQFTPCEASPILSPSLASLFPSTLAFYYRKFYHTWRSGLYRSVVCDIRAPYSGIETFGNISPPFCTLAIPSKFYGDCVRGTPPSEALNAGGDVAKQSDVTFGYLICWCVSYLPLMNSGHRPVWPTLLVKIARRTKLAWIGIVQASWASQTEVVWTACFCQIFVFPVSPWPEVISSVETVADRPVHCIEVE